MKMPNETISSVGQIPIDAQYYCTLRSRSVHSGTMAVILLDRSLEEIGTFRVDDPAVLNCLYEVTRRENKAKRSKDDSTRLKPLRYGYSLIVKEEIDLGR